MVEVDQMVNIENILWFIVDVEIGIIFWIIGCHLDKWHDRQIEKFLKGE